MVYYCKLINYYICEKHKFTIMKERLIKFMETEKITSAELADNLGVQRSSISHLLAERNKPSYDFINRFLNTFPYVNAEWFITGKGVMYKKVKQASLFEEFEDKEKGKLAKDTTTEKEVGKQEYSGKTVKQSEIRKPIDYERQSESTRKYEGKIIRVIVFYDNGTFEAYIPGEE